MNGIAHISSPYTENWVYWVVLLLMTLMMINYSVRNSLVIAFRTISSHSERVYGGNSNILGRINAWIFRIALLALVMHIAFYKGGIFAFKTYLIIVGVVGIICLTQYILTIGIGWIFVTRKNLENGLGLLEMVRNSVALTLLPMPLLMMWIDNSLCKWILLSIIGAFFVILTLTKSLQLFYKNFLSFVYILVYLIYLEIIPIGGMVIWIQHILQ